MSAQVSQTEFGIILQKILTPLNLEKRHHRQCFVAVVLALLLLCFWSRAYAATAAGLQVQGDDESESDVPTRARNPRLEPPPSNLHTSSFDAPIFITGHLGFGGSLQYDQFQLNYGGSIIFRPKAAGNFLSFLDRINTGMVLQLDYQHLTSESRILSSDLVFRHYFDDRGDEKTEVLPFLGFGFGASDVRVITEEGNADSRYWSWLIEAGQEWSFKPNVMFVARFQFRNFSYNDVSATTFTISGALGLPLPW
ncbi:MAG: hypothetical protein ACI9UK_000527 [Candidatus Krumholzibacteriia bacterium]